MVGLLFENYIVNASIFIRSNFFEIFEPGSDAVRVPFWGCVGGVGFHGSLDEYD